MKILVAYDGGEPAHRALELAAELAEQVRRRGRRRQRRPGPSRPRADRSVGRPGRPYHRSSPRPSSSSPGTASSPILYRAGRRSGQDDRANRRGRRLRHGRRRLARPRAAVARSSRAASPSTSRRTPPRRSSSPAESLVGPASRSGRSDRLAWPARDPAIRCRPDVPGEGRPGRGGRRRPCRQLRPRRCASERRRSR